MNVESSKQLKPFVANQLPDFVKVDHPTFVTFLEAYYEWLDQQNDPFRNPLKLQSIINLDETLEQFLGQFKKQYLESFPESLAVSSVTGLPVSPQNLIKNIRAYYKAKGTEKTYQFLFRILYDTNVEFYYPKNDILRCSDGKWIQNRSIRTTNTLGRSIFNAIGKKIFQTDTSGNISAAAEVVDVSRYQLSAFEVSELFLKNINGTFEAEKSVFFTSGDIEYTEQKIYTIVTGITISNAGTKYRIGDKLIFTPAANDTGQKAEGKVTQVDASGSVVKVEITNFGINYKIAPTVTIESNKGTGFVGTVSVGAVGVFEGYFANNDGKLSSSKKLQDNHYYQNFSYVLKTEVTVNKYKEILKKLIHPAGLGFFGQVLIKRNLFATVDKASLLARYEIPYIGNYAPYTFYTFDDLSQWFLFGGTAAGFIPDYHTPIIQGYGAGIAIQGNPISNLFEFDPGTGDYCSTPGFDRGDPFYIVYQHPNQKIVGNILTRIEYAQKDEFVGTTGTTGWSEWQMTGSTERSEWSSGFTSGFKYAIVQYDSGSEFRKIAIRSFLEMPIGDKFDCRFDEGIVK